MGAIAPVVGSLFDRYGPTPLVIPGMIIVAGALWGMTTFDAATSLAWIVAVHVTLSLGLGLLFTPLFTSALGSLPRHLYSHGSAIMGTLQQVAGAAGTALFVTIMTVTAASLAQTDGGGSAAIAAGVHNAFLVGAIVASAGVPLACLVRRPADTSQAGDESRAMLAH